MKYRVVHIITSSDIGGAQQHVQDIVTNLNKEYFQPIVICGVGGNFDEKLRSLGIETYKLESLDKKINFYLDFITLFKLVRLLKKIKPAIVHTHSSKAGLLGRIAAKLCGIPLIIFTAHGFVFHEYMPKPKYLFYLQLEKLTGLITDQIIAVSELDNSKAKNNSVIKPEKLQTIHNGIDVDLFRPDPSLSTDIIEINPKTSKHKILVGLVGRLVEEKGIQYFIEAAKQVNHKHPETQFILVGDGPLKVSMEELVNSKNLSNNFIFTGTLEDVKFVLSTLDIVVFSSIKEGLPLALLEAMAMEKAVVATRAGGIPEVITSGRDGLLAPIGNSNLIAEAIIILIENSKLRNEMGKEARTTVVKRFSLMKMVERTEQVYLRLLSKKKLL